MSYFVDGLNFAKAIEDEDSRSFYFFHPHHLLYAPAGYILYEAAALIGFTLRAVTVLQIISGVMGALGVSIFFLLLRKLRVRQRIALTSSLFLAFSYGYWYHSINVKSTIPALTLLIISLYFLVGFKKGVLGPILCGVFHGVSILLHHVHVLFAVPVLAFFLLGNRKRNLVWYFVGFIPSLGIPYLIVGILVAEVRSVGEFFRWSTYYLHVEPSYWEAGASSFVCAVRSVGISLFGGHYLFLRDYRLLAAAGAVSAVLLFLLISLSRLLVDWRKFRGRFFYIMILWSMCYAGFHLFWCHYSFWVIQLVPFFCLLSLLWNDGHRRITTVLPFMLAVYLGLNLFGNIIPKHRSPPEYVQFIHELREDSRRDDLFIVLGILRARNRQIEYLNPNISYSLDREYWTLSQIVQDGERAMIEIEDRIRQGRSVYLWWDFTPRSMEWLDPPCGDVVRQIFAEYATVPTFSRGEMVVTRLVPVE